MDDKHTYDSLFQLLISLDTLSETIGQSLIHEEPTSSAEDYCKQIIWTMGPANRMLVWGLEANQNLAAMNGLRTLLENYANANYVFRAGKKGRDYYLNKIGDTAEYYQNAFSELQKDTTLSIECLTEAPKWSGLSLTDRVGKLGEGALFQYEYLCRYVHADVWATLNQFSIKDRDYTKKWLLSWGVDFVNDTLCLMSEEKLINQELQSGVLDLSNRFSALTSK